MTDIVEKLNKPNCGWMGEAFDGCIPFYVGQEAKAEIERLRGKLDAISEALKDDPIAKKGGTNEA